MNSLFLWWNIPQEFCSECGLMSAAQLSRACAPRRKGGSGTCICCEKHMQLNLAHASRFYLFWRLWDTSNLGWKRAWEDIFFYFYLGSCISFSFFPPPRKKSLCTEDKLFLCLHLCLSGLILALCRHAARLIGICWFLFLAFSSFVQ